MKIDDYNLVSGIVEAHSYLLSHRWMSNALRYFGTAEINDRQSRIASGTRLSDPLIIQFFATAMGTTYRTRHTSALQEITPDTQPPLVCSPGYTFRGIDDSTTPWCSAFANHIMITSGFGGTHSLAARSWGRWGRQMPESEVLFGAIAVFRREDPDNPNAGHVGFYFGEQGNQYLILGGNQGNRVCVATYPKADLLSFRWPNVSS